MRNPHSQYSKARFPGRIPLNHEARATVREALKALGPDATYREIAQHTGINAWDVLDYLGRISYLRKPRQVQKKTKRKCKAKPIWSSTMKDRPQFVQEAEATLGLKAVLLTQTSKDSEWILMSPTGVAIIKLIGSTDLITHAQVVQNKSAFQGLTQADRLARQRAKRKRIEKPQEPQAPENPDSDDI